MNREKECEKELRLQEKENDKVYDAEMKKQEDFIENERQCDYEMEMTNR